MEGVLRDAKAAHLGRLQGHDGPARHEEVVLAGLGRVPPSPETRPGGSRVLSGNERVDRLQRRLLPGMLASASVRFTEGERADRMVVSPLRRAGAVERPVLLLTAQQLENALASDVARVNDFLGHRVCPLLDGTVVSAGLEEREERKGRASVGVFGIPETGRVPPQGAPLTLGRESVRRPRAVGALVAGEPLQTRLYGRLGPGRSAPPRIALSRFEVLAIPVAATMTAPVAARGASADADR